MLKRLLCLITVPFVLVALAASPASATVNPTFARFHPGGYDIVCPLPWVDTAIVPGSYCVEIGRPRGGFGWYSPVSTDIPTFVDSFPLLDSHWCTFANVRGTDGVVGFVNVVGLLDLGTFGNYRPGMQYANYGFQPIGRPGLYRPFDNQFYPQEGWHYVTDDVPVPDNPQGCL